MTLPLQERLERLRARMVEAAQQSGRSADSVRLVAVSKKQPIESIRSLYHLGQRAFGENYAQELQEKAAALQDLQIEWHFIGPFQTNKAKVLATCASWVETIGSVHAAQEFGRRVSQKDRAPVPVLVQVNVGGSPQKHGCTPGDLREVLDAVEREPSLHLRGLMTIPEEANAQHGFETLSTLRLLHGGITRLPELSMGMSQDLDLAIAAGATIVRVGTALFGPRLR